MTALHIVAIATMPRDQIAGAWFAHFVALTGDDEARAAILARMSRDGITPRQMADRAHAAGLIGDEQLAMLRGRG